MAEQIPLAELRRQLRESANVAARQVTTTSARPPRVLVPCDQLLILLDALDTAEGALRESHRVFEDLRVTGIALNPNDFPVWLDYVPEQSAKTLAAISEALAALEGDTDEPR